MVLLLPGEKKVGSRQVSEFTGTHLEHKPFFVTHETKRHGAREFSIGKQIMQGRGISFFSLFLVVQGIKI